MNWKSRKPPAIRVLLVEDNPGDADLVKEGAEAERHRPVRFETCASLAEALDSIDKNPPDVVLLDLGLPDSMGIETFEHLHEAAPNMPIIVLTGNDDVTTAVCCIERGAHDYLIKGRVESFIASAIHNTVARAKTQDALNESRENIERMVADSQDPIVVLGLDHAVLFANRAASVLFGEQIDPGRRFDVLLGEEQPQEFDVPRADGSAATVAMRIGDTCWHGEPARVLSFRDVTERNASAARLEHLTMALKAIRNVNQLIVREKDPATLIGATCELLIETRGYNGAWICLGNPQGQPSLLAQAGWEERFKPFASMLEGGSWSGCHALSASASDGFVLLQPEDACQGCPLSGEYNHDLAAVVALRYEGQDFGTLGVSFPKSVAMNQEEKSLLLELAADIAFAIYDIEITRRHQEAEKQFQVITESSADAIFITNQSGRYVYVNAAACELLGYTSEELLQMGIADIVVRDAVEANWKRFQEVQEKGRRFFELELVRKDGSVIPVDLNAVLLPNGLVYGSCRDLTERKRAEQALKNSEAKHKLAQKVAHIGHWELNSDEGMPTWSEEIFRILGLDPSASEPSLAEHEAFIHPDDWVLLQRAVREGLESGTPFDLQFKILRAGGEVGWVHAIGTAQTSAAGNTTVMFGTAQDITELKQAQREIAERERLLSTITTNMFDMVSLADTEVRCTYASPSFRQVGHEPDDIVGRHFYDFVHDEDREQVVTLLADPQNTSETRRAVYRFRRGNGSYAWLESIGKVLSDDQGRPTGLLFSSRDMTTYKELQSQLAQSDRLSSMGMLAAGVAHEINNPLSYVLYNLESLMEDLPGLLHAVGRVQSKLVESNGPTGISVELSEKLNPMLLDDILARFRDALGGTHRIRDIARSLGTFSRVERDELVPVNLMRVIEAAVNMCFNEIKYRAQVVKDYGEIPTVMGSEGRLSQVFLNLLVNAAHAIVEGDVENNEIRLRTWTEGATVCAEVRDTGKGIEPKHMTQLFEPFFTTKEIGVGSGLGLPISKGIIEGYGGTIDVESEPGQWTSFRIRLPVSGEQVVPACATAEAVQEKRLLGRILIVDDEDGIRAALERMLREHETVAVSSGEMAMKILEGDRAFDFILCDMMMAKVSGMELHAWLLQRDPGLANRIVFITGGAFTPRAREYLKNVGNHRLEKPFDVVKFKRVVAELVRTSGRTDV